MRKLLATQKIPSHQSNKALAPASCLHRPLNAEHSTPIEQVQAPSRFIHNFANVPVHSHTIIQPKLTIGQVGDKYEQEADQIAVQVVNQINTPDMAPINSVQRTEIQEEDELMMKPESCIQRLAPVQTNNSTPVNPELENSIQQARGGGQPLADSVREPMERAFGADFSLVKVHTDSQANQLNKLIQAKAFTTGQDVFFRQGVYQPESQEGQKLIAHELTHVVQQNSNREHYIQRDTASDLEEGTYALNNSYGYYKFVEPGLTSYKEFIENLTKGNITQQQLAGDMAKGYKAWSSNWYNKTQAYLYEGQKASDNTWLRTFQNSFGILGVDTDLESDLEVHIEEGGQGGSSWKSTASEYKASTSADQSAVYKLCVEGIQQLAKREKQKDKYGKPFNRLLLTIHNDNSNNSFPYTDGEWKKNPQWDKNREENAADQLYKRMKAKLEEYIKSTYVEIRLEHDGRCYATAWYEPATQDLKN